MNFSSTSTSVGSNLEEAEFILENKEVTIASPKRTRRSHLKSLGKQRKCKKKKCNFCTYLFDTQILLEMHTKVCGMRLQNQAHSNKLKAINNIQVNKLLLSIIKENPISDLLAGNAGEYLILCQRLESQQVQQFH